jgi:hypothetical protein
MVGKEEEEEEEEEEEGKLSTGLIVCDAGVR